MKTLIKFILALALVTGLQAQTAVTGHAADAGSVAADAGGDVVGPVSSTDNAFARWSGTTGKLLQDTSDLTYSTPTMSVPDAFNVSSAGSISLTAGGSGDKAITLTPHDSSANGSVPVKVITRADSVETVGSGMQIKYDNLAANTFPGYYAYLYKNSLAGYPLYVLGAAQGTMASPATNAATSSVAETRHEGYANGAWRILSTVLTRTGTTYSDSDYVGQMQLRVMRTGTGGTLNDGILIYGSDTAGAKVIVDSLDATNAGQFQVRPGNITATSWLTNGAVTNVVTPTVTNSSAGSTTYATAVMNSWTGGTLAASNALTVTTDAFNGYFTAPTQGANQSITRKHTLGVVDSTSASSSITGGFIVAATLGTTATSTGIGGGNINTGGTITAGSSITGTFNINSVQSLSGAGAVNVTDGITEYTSTGGSQALTLANGTAGQIKYIVHGVDGGSGILTPTTKTGYTTITFTNAGDSVTLVYLATRGWVIVGIFGAVAA